METPLVALVAFIACFIAVPLVLAILRRLGLYAIVQERRCLVFVLFGKVVAVLDEPGLHLLWLEIGPRALLASLFGRRYEIDLRLDQEYLRSAPVNSEEGAPMGIGIWFEMFISDPVAYLFKNTDPRGSLSANVSNSTVRCLSNMPLAQMLSSRHAMSQTVRKEVSPLSHDWGYRLGSVYIRKVHFRDADMIRQIESKVVNRLRQVTSSIRQDGVNQVNVITSEAESRAAVAFAQAGAVRPEVVGVALQEICTDPDVSRALFEVLEAQGLLSGKAALTLVPRGAGLMPGLLAALPEAPQPPAPPVRG